MKYIMFVCSPDVPAGDVSATGAEAEMVKIGAWYEAQVAAGHVVSPSYQLDGVTAARTVRAGPDGGVLVTDGPFAETKEVIGGVGAFEYGSLDEAVEAAAAWIRIDPAYVVEMRPIVDE